MSVRTKYIIGNFYATINDNDRNNIIITVKHSFKELKKVGGEGFKLNDNQEIYCTCKAKDYSKMISRLEELLYEIVLKTSAIEKRIKEEVKNVSENSSSGSNSNKRGTDKGDKSGNDEKDKK